MTRIVIISLIVICQQCLAESIKLTGIVIDPALLGSEWQRSDDTVIIDDVNDLSTVPAEKADIAKAIVPAFKSIKIKSAGDISFKRKSGVGLIVNKIYIFESAEACQSWASKKHQVDWGGYKMTGKVPDYQLDDEMAGKTIRVMGDRVVITTCTVTGTPEETLQLAVKAGDLILKALK